MTELIHIPVTFRLGTRLPAEIDDPAVVHRAIAAVRSSDGDLLASDIVAAASDPASPIHAAFEWDDAVAGERYREGQAFYLAGSLIDAKTGERVYVSRYKETNSLEDVGRIRVNVRLLPPPEAPPQKLAYTVRQQSPAPARPAIDTPILLGMPQVEVVDRTPEEDRSLVVFRRWVDAHRHEPEVLRAALRLLYEAL